ncbi:DUF4377 domain-containing protein [Chryseobacterium fistulae]|uniref:DUF4377 domain-containing protein n=1 Tax=Chryseobacterium fistulae TaxID=2675058 RepID=A0A6N4XMA4_9FLAO|nr:DUF4377 domain-containing protein [Chryseobacterium fistulae]CAA7386907.1 hypothetical protein CHRY9393_01208 [Chryseobacterium fistulae]
MKIYKILSLSLMALTFSSCANNEDENFQAPTSENVQNRSENTLQYTSANEKTLIVGAQTAGCVGVAPMQCLQVKETPNANWTNFYSHIQGFNYVAGYEYVLRVKVQHIANPPADGSSIAYTLVKVVSKVKK